MVHLFATSTSPSTQDSSFPPPLAAHREEAPEVVAAVDVAARVVRLALLLRLAAVVVCLLAVVGSELDNRTALAMLTLAATSVVGLSNPRYLSWVVARPLFAMADVAVVLLVIVVVGAESPLTLAVLSTSLIAGVLFTAPMATILGVTLAVGYFVVATAGTSSVQGFVMVLGIPVMVGCLVAIGQAIRSIERQFLLLQYRHSRALHASAADEERGRLARELHDGIAKSLQGLALGAAALPAWLDQDGDVASAQARQLSAGAQDAVREARQLLSQLRADRPGEPFGAVVEDILRGWASGFGGEVRFSGSEEAALGTQVRYELLAALRECLTNVEKHAPGAEVTVYLRSDASSVHLVVSDAGPGFDPVVIPSREREGHFGLRGLSERMASVGGSASVESEPGVGTTVALRAPRLAVSPDGQTSRGEPRG